MNDTIKRIKNQATDVEKIFTDKSHNQQRIFIQNIFKKNEKTLGLPRQSSG